MTVQTTYRTCPRSGLQFEKQAEALMKINAVTAVVALLVGGLLAIGVVLTRWPAVHWLAADTFYMVLTAHGIDMLIFWIIFFEVAVLYFASSTLLRCRLATPKIAWAAYLRAGRVLPRHLRLVLLRQLEVPRPVVGSELIGSPERCTPPRSSPPGAAWVR